MVESRRVPPGRAGRLWLQRREHTGQRALDLLDRKLRILRAEQERFHVMSAEASKRWVEAATEADRWGVRAAALTGREGFRWGATVPRAEVRIEWASVMGVTYPSEAKVDLPQPEPGASSPGSVALDRAAGAYGTALRAAAEHAVAEVARRIIDAEVQAVRQRRTAIRNRWLPRLRGLLHELETRLEEDERAETARWRQLAGDETR